MRDVQDITLFFFESQAVSESESVNDHDEQLVKARCL
jgi:hypothetical protein